MDFCGCGEDIALQQMFAEEEQATFSTSEQKLADPASKRPVASRSVSVKPFTEGRQEDVVVETVDSDGTMERQTVFNPKGRDAPSGETEDETEAADIKETKIETKKGSKTMFKLPKLKKRSKK